MRGLHLGSEKRTQDHMGIAGLGGKQVTGKMDWIIRYKQQVYLLHSKQPVMTILIKRLFSHSSHNDVKKLSLIISK